ncbi:MAG TPA: MarR family transcriptional regulator [Acidimicrobiales bacterium]|nr:MarR family transcriptional regulator [Acidimicrobiales bacterium]
MLACYKRYNGEVVVDELGAEAQLVAERIRAAWRDLRRSGSSGAVRATLYEPDPPLDVAQADALDLVVSHAPVRMNEIASLLRVDPSTATRTVAKLLDHGLVVRQPDPVDARVVLVAPSQTGAELHARVRARATAMLAANLESFDAEDRERLATLMERLVAAIDERRSITDAS